MDSLAIEFTDITDNGFADLEAQFANAQDIGETKSADPIFELEKEALAAFEQAVSDIKVIRQSHVTQVASSMGKDSTLLLLAALKAHEELLSEGKLAQDAPFVVSTIDTKVENHLMSMLVKEEVARLSAYCTRKNINLDMRFASPPLSKQWASLFLSGHKMLSTARLNNDCSVILKIDQSERIERAIKKCYGDVVILVGSRSEESLKREQSLKKRNQANRDVHDFLDKVANEREANVFAPISHMTTDEVWMLLRRAGTAPIVTPILPNMHVPSYGDNHLLLAVVYGDSQDGTCPTTSKAVKGQAVGGCGKSARTGCSLCLKSLKDSSGEAQSKLPRHSIISGNMLKIRNYLAYVAEDMSRRSWHTRAIDGTTGAITAYPNVLNAQTIDELMKLFIQATADEHIRAKEFAHRVAVGDEMLDEGYADIIHDPMLSEREKFKLAEVYKRHAQQPLHNPMSMEICLYLSFIHARDGMKLPPYRAVALWNELYIKFMEDIEEKRYETMENGVFKDLSHVHQLLVAEYEEKGLRLPYPNVDVNNASRDDAPDAVMIMPDFSLDEFDYVPHTGVFNAEDVIDCMVSVAHDSVKLPMSQAKRLLPSGHNIETESVSLRGFVMEDSHRVFRDKPIAVSAKKEVSKRAISKLSKKKGNIKVLARGRTSVGSHSFRARTADTVLSDRLSTAVTLPKLALETHYLPMNDPADDTIGTYDINTLGYYNWLDYDGFERALKSHDKTIARRLTRGESIYHWSGISVVEEMQRYGLFDLSPNAVKSSMFNLRRTTYFGALGIFKLSDEAFIELASGAKRRTKKELNTSHPMLYVNSVMPMTEYRRYKAGVLLSLRNKRNHQRKALKQQHAQFENDPIEHDLKLASQSINTLLEHFYSQIVLYQSGSLISSYCKSAIEAYAKYLSDLIGQEDQFLKLFSSASKRRLKHDLASKKRVEQTRAHLYTSLTTLSGIDSFNVDWQPYQARKVSIKQKPVEHSGSLVW